MLLLRTFDTYLSRVCCGRFILYLVPTYIHTHIHTTNQATSTSIFFAVILIIFPDTKLISKGLVQLLHCTCIFVTLPRSTTSYRPCLHTLLQSIPRLLLPHSNHSHFAILKKIPTYYCQFPLFYPHKRSLSNKTR